MCLLQCITITMTFGQSITKTFGQSITNTGQFQSVIITTPRPSITYITLYYIYCVIYILIMIQCYKCGTSWINSSYLLNI